MIKLKSLIFEGMTYDQAESIFKRFGVPNVLKLSPEELIYISKVKKRIFANSLSLCNLNENLYTEFLANKLWGLVTNGSIESSILLLKHFGIHLNEDRIFSPTADLRPKPFPDIYIKAVNFFGIDPTLIKVLEDTSDGVRAARSAGLKVSKVAHRC